MTSRIADLRHKDVININTGTRIGCVSDVEIDTGTARLTALVIYGRPRWFGLLGHYDDLMVTWDDIDVIGEDSILVHCTEELPRERQCGFIETLLKR